MSAPVHFVVAFAVRLPIVACGVVTGQDSSTLRKDVTCGNCKRTKVFRGEEYR